MTFPHPSPTSLLRRGPCFVCPLFEGTFVVVFGDIITQDEGYTHDLCIILDPGDPAKMVNGDPHILQLPGKPTVIQQSEYFDRVLADFLKKMDHAGLKTDLHFSRTRSTLSDVAC